MHKNKDSAYKYITRAYKQMSLKKREDAITLNIHTIMGEYYLTYGQPENAEKNFYGLWRLIRKPAVSFLSIPNISITISGPCMTGWGIRRKPIFISMPIQKPKAGPIPLYWQQLIRIWNPLLPLLKKIRKSIKTIYSG